MIPFDQKKIIDFKSGLYVVSTPIGNMMDITLNALEILKLSNLILCEDTRVSKKILDKYNIKNKELFAYHKFNEKKSLKKVIDLIKNDKIVSIISDAGTPCISDPGSILVNECIRKELNIFSIPGPSSVITSVSISGFSDKFIFYGFFPEKTKDIKRDIEILSKINLSIVFFISAKKFKKASVHLKNFFSDRKIVICREISKLYEEYIRLDINELKTFDKELKGELTVIISEKKKINKSSLKLSESDKKNIKKMINKLSTKEIVNLLSQNNRFSKKEIYNYCLKLKNEN